MSKSDTDLPYTHEVSLVLRSNADTGEVQVLLKWSPDMQGEDYRTLGYRPACHVFVEKHIMPMLEQVFIETAHPELMGPAVGSIN